jgi:hypothetical protein
MQEEITRDTLVASGGQVISQRIRDMLGLGPVPTHSIGADAAAGQPTEEDEYELERTNESN